MENKTVAIIGTGVLRHYKKDMPYQIPLGRFLSLPKNAFIPVNPKDMDMRVQNVHKESDDEPEQPIVNLGGVPVGTLVPVTKKPKTNEVPEDVPSRDV